MICEVHDEALQEYHEQAVYLDEQQGGLGDDFTVEVDAVLKRIAEDPERYPLLETTRSSRRFRRAHVKRFHVLVIYEVLEGEPYVVSISHAARRPGHWEHRRPE